MTTLFTYSEANDFPGATINLDKMHDEIVASAITIALLAVRKTGDVVEIEFKADLPAGDKTILDGDTTNPAGGLIALHDNSPSVSVEQVQLSNIQQDSDMRIEVATGPPVGLTERVLVSPNLCDQTTWYYQSTRVTDEVAVDSGDGLTFNLANANVIDMYHGKVFDEYHLRQDGGDEYKVVVKVDTVEVTEREAFAASGGDYTVDYAAGSITFASSQSGSTVEVSYNYPASSVWSVVPSSGKRLDIQYAEAQFSSDLEMESAMIVSIHGFVDVFAPQLAVSNGGPIPDGTVIELDRWPYQTIDNIIEEAVSAQPVIPIIGTNARGTATTRQIFPFRYNAARDIRSSYGMMLCIQTGNNVPWSGERASVTFYSVERDE